MEYLYTGFLQTGVYCGILVHGSLLKQPQNFVGVKMSVCIPPPFNPDLPLPWKMFEVKKQQPNPVANNPLAILSIFLETSRDSHIRHLCNWCHDIPTLHCCDMELEMLNRKFTASYQTKLLSIFFWKTRTLQYYKTSTVCVSSIAL